MTACQLVGPPSKVVRPPGPVTSRPHVPEASAFSHEPLSLCRQVEPAGSTRMVEYRPICWKVDGP